MLQQITGFEGILRAVPSGDAPRGQRIARDRVNGAKRAFTTRRVDLSQQLRILSDVAPQAGDLILARVTALGQHQRLESPHGRRAQLYEGDEIIVAYGARYAPDQFEAVVPPDLGPCDLVAGGGVAGRVLSSHARMRRATRIEPIGLLADIDGQRINLARFALPAHSMPKRRQRVIVVAGTSMNAGKTTAAAGLIHGLARAGLKVASAKVTGTGSGGDLWTMVDAGSSQAIDFTDMGHASTAGLAAEQVERVALSLIGHVAAGDPDAIVVEVADGLLQRETAALLRSGAFRDAIDGVLFAAGDALGAVAGRDWLMRERLPVIGISGLLSASPLASREAAAALDCDVLSLDQLRDPALAPKLCFAAEPLIRISQVVA